MTTPEQPRPSGQAAEPSAEQPTAEQPTAPAAPPAAEQPPGAASQQPAVAAPQQQQQPPPVPEYAARPADPFAPIPRPPKSPWIAPQRKGAVIGISVAAALVLLLAGGVIDRVAFDNDHPARSVEFGGPGPRYLPGPQLKPRMPQLPGQGNRNHPRPQPSSVPTPSETS